MLSLQPIFIFICEAIYSRIIKYMQTNYWYKNHTNNNLDNIKFLELNAGPEY